MIANCECEVGTANFGEGGWDSNLQNGYPYRGFRGQGAAGSIGRLDHGCVNFVSGQTKRNCEEAVRALKFQWHITV